MRETELNEVQRHALILRTKAIERVTTHAGRAVTRLIALPSYVTRGYYLPAPILPRFLQGDPNAPFSDSSWFTISQGVHDSVTGMTVIAHHETYYGIPDSQIIYDFPSRNNVEVRFYGAGGMRYDPASLEADLCVSMLSYALEQRETV